MSGLPARPRVLAAVALAALAATATAAALASWSAERGARIGQAAPDIAGGPWINSEPLTLAGLRGRVVFVEFWTYG